MLKDHELTLEVDSSVSEAATQVLLALAGMLANRNGVQLTMICAAKVYESIVERQALTA